MSSNATSSSSSVHQNRTWMDSLTCCIWPIVFELVIFGWYVNECKFKQNAMGVSYLRVFEAEFFSELLALRFGDVFLDLKPPLQAATLQFGKNSPPHHSCSFQIKKYNRNFVLLEAESSPPSTSDCLKWKPWRLEIRIDWVLEWNSMKLEQSERVRNWNPTGEVTNGWIRHLFWDAVCYWLRYCWINWCRHWTRWSWNKVKRGHLGGAAGAAAGAAGAAEQGAD